MMLTTSYNDIYNIAQLHFTPQYAVTVKQNIIDGLSDCLISYKVNKSDIDRWGSLIYRPSNSVDLAQYTQR